MAKEIRKSGIDAVGDVRWGTRICLFFQTEEDLLEVLVPYFRAGLKNHEYCLWVTSEPVNKTTAEKILRKLSITLDRYLDRRQIEIIPYREWYLDSGKLDPQRVGRKLLEKLEQALARNYQGMRVAGGTTWLRKRPWPQFIDYEKTTSGSTAKMIAICAYSLKKCGIPDIIDVVNTHQFALLKRNGKWEAIERRERNRMEDTLNKRVKELRCLYDTASITTSVHINLPQKFLEIVNLLPGAFQYPSITYASITLGADHYQTSNYVENVPKLSADIIVHGDRAGLVEVGYTEEPSETDNGLFSKEEGLLLDAVAEHIGEIIEHSMAEEALKESEEKFSKAFNASPDIMTITTLDEGKIINVNDRFIQATGYGREEVIGRRTIEIGNWFSEEDRYRMVRALKERGHVCDLEVGARVKSGEVRLGQLSAELIDIRGQPCVITAIKDITEQRQSQELLMTVSQSSPLGIYIMQDGILKYINPQFQKITGYRQEELLERDVLNLVAIEDTDVFKSSTVYTLREQNPYPCEYRVLSKTGQIKWVMQTVAPIHYEGKAAILGNIMDITERKYLERKVIEYEELSKMKSDLLATVSHELRTPLATIKGYSTMILDYSARLTREETSEYLKAIDGATDRLAKLVDNLLETSRMEAGLLKLDKSVTSISQLIRDVIVEARIRASRHHVASDLGKKLPRVVIDAKRIRQVLDNLIDNAIKYSPPDTDITVSAKRTSLELLISVTDQGPGIPDEELKHIFDRMYRIEQRLYSGVNGIGLGLYICQRLIEAHGGRIWAESTVGKGSTIKFIIPITPSLKKERPVTRSDG